jgi:thioredoxin reductase
MDEIADRDVDVLVVGGGPAGLAAALILGRCLRTVLICDTGRQRNRFAHAIHGLPGQEGRSPSDFLADLRKEVACYKTVSASPSLVTAIARRPDGRFAFETRDLNSGTAAKVLIATGLIDDLPDIPGLPAFYGTSVHHCLYCDGAEYAGAPMLAYGPGDKAGALALMMSHWSPHITACCPDSAPGPAIKSRLFERRVEIVSDPIAELIGKAGRLTSVKFADGRTRDCAALFFSTGCSQGSPLADQLGCRRDEAGAIITDPKTEETTQPGIYVAGDVSRDVLLVAVAIAEGAKAGVAINRALLERDGLL